MTTPTQTTCPYCGVGCGVIATVESDQSVSIKGDPAHPANYGKLCSKGAALGETLDMEGRLLHPEVDGVRASWPDALQTVAERFGHIIQRHGPDSVAFYVSGQLLTEDYYVANKLTKGFIGSANIDTNSRLCMSSAVAGYKRAFGSDTVPCCYEDLERAKLIVLVGSNTAWCHPVLFQRMRRVRRENPDLHIIVIDPRKTATCDIADQHLPLKPGTDTILFNGLLCYLHDQGETNLMFIDAATQGLQETLVAARAAAPDTASVAAECGLAEADLIRFYRLFARTERVVTLFSQGVNQFSYGTNKVNSIINCHLITGRIGRPGMGPFSITGQPNAMGGREVGGLSNQLAAHLEIDNPAHQSLAQAFWQSPVIARRAGLKAVDLFNAVGQNQIKAIWIMATNPAVSLPDNAQVHAALRQCECVVVSDCMRHTDTTAYADILLPAQTWGEKEGAVTNSERRISRQRAFLPPPGEARPDWWIISQVARRMGFGAAFNYASPADIFREHARLSSYQNEGQRDFDISALSQLSDDEYDQLTPVQWPVNAAHPQGAQRLFGDGRFYTPERKARFVPIQNRTPANPPDADYPYRLNTGRVRDHWHTMTRTGKSARLSGHAIEPFAEMHPQDAQTLDIQANQLVRLSSRWGELIVRALVSEAQQPGSLFAPIHWNHQFSGAPGVGCLINPNTDPVSGQPEFKHTPVDMQPYTAAWYGFILSRRQLAIHDADYWVCAKDKRAWRYELAGGQSAENWAGYARGLLCHDDEQVEWLEYFDTAKNRYRAARLVDGALESCIFIGPDIELPPRDWLAGLFTEDALDANNRIGLLTGKPGQGQADAGKTICSCFHVGLNTIQALIQSRQATSVEQIGALLKAGTNCGSCIPELQALLNTAE